MRRIVILLALAACARAHVGSPDIFLEGSAGPYPLFVTIRPPSVIPGVAEIEIRCSSPGVREIRLTPTPLTGPGATFAPTPDLAERSKQDPNFFTGSLWMMAPGSWQVRVQVEGGQGPGRLSVPVPAVALRTKAMQKTLGALLFIMMIVLAVGLVSIVGAGAREGQLEPGVAPNPRSKRRARILMFVTAAIVVLILWGGERWWTAEANNYSDYIYKPLNMSAAIEPHDKLVLKLSDPGWALMRKLDDFLPDHGHLMHLYVIRQPDAGRVWHLHPDMTSSGVFTHYLPPMPAGQYKLYADVVHRSGFPETMVADLRLPSDLAGTPLTGDDAAGSRTPPAGAARIVWDRDAASLKARQPATFKFRLVRKDGQPVPDMELYMGMPGHAAFLKADGTVFAHVHPSGSVPMAALALANPATAADHSMHEMHPLPAEATFPYGFPSPGDYHIIVQMKHGGVIETGIFDARVE
ncbi:MAG: hypothetical protein DMG59_01480 [Acidobacteria bacterium]|nr:MAG: hypothetical protein DMG59_01480 [Acidobacteriota bacterium]